MNVTRPTPTTGTDIITLAAMKEFLRVDYDDEDATITAMMDAAVAHCSDVTNRHFTADSAGTFYLPYFRPAALAFGPVTGVQSVQYYDTAGDLQTLNTALWWVESRDNQVWRIFFRDTPDLEDYNATPVIVNCRVGKVASPNIKHALKMIVAHWYETRRAVVVGSGIGSSEVPMAVNALLNPERLETAWQ